MPVLLLLISACQTGGPPALSLEEAKKATASFANSSFVPPPKSVNDILSKIANADLRPRPCADITDFSDAEIRRLMRIAPARNAKIPGSVKIAEIQADHQFRRGNFQRSVKYLRWAIDAVPPGFNSNYVRATRAMLYARLATYLAYAGHFDAAEDALSDALGSGQQVKRIYLGKWTLARYNLQINEARGAIAASKGNLRLAEGYFRLVSKEYSMVVRDRYPFIRLELARTLMRQGRLQEAETVARDALGSRLSRNTISPVSGALLAQLGEVLYEQGRYADAENLAREAVKLMRAACAAPESVMLVTARDLLARSLLAGERWDEALKEYEAIRTGMAKDPESFKRMFEGDLYRGLALLRAGRTGEAGANLRAAFERTRERLGEKHYRTAEISGFLAMIRAAEGNKRESLAEFAAATDILLRRSREADDDSTTFRARDRRLAIILGAYIGLLADIRGTALERDAGVDAVGESFRLAGMARSRTVQRALAASGARAALTDPVLVDLARREQDTQKQIAALYGTLSKLLSGAFFEADQITALRTRVDQLRGARAALIEEIETRFPEYARLINPRPATIEEARAALHPGDALIATYVGEDRTFVWAIPRTGDIAFAAADVAAAELTDRVAVLRAALAPNADTLGDIPEFDLDLAHGLYEDLLEPVKAGWEDAENLLVVAHGPLGYLPLSVLPTEPAEVGAGDGPLFAGYRHVPWLARSHAVTVLPSVASLKTLRGLPPGDPGRKAFAGFGDPLFKAAQATEEVAEAATPGARGMATRGLPVHLRAAPDTAGLDSADLAKLPRLPDTAEEIRGTAMALKADLTEDVFLGTRANEHTVKTMDLSGYKVVAFATHGLVPGDLDGLTQPALALTAPEIAGVEGDGLLTMGEILGLKLDADWVVLSACNTGSGQGAGAEAVSGLGRAFFYAGTRALLVSNWPVETTSARALTTDLFRRQAGDASLSRAQALRQAMLALIDGPGAIDTKTGKAVFSYAHPIFWAPFSLIGDGGGKVR